MTQPITDNTPLLETIPYVYGRFGNIMKDKAYAIHIFGTSSKGNSIYIKNIRTLIDLGLPFVRYSDYDPNFFNQVDYIILTHEHGDHFNRAAFLKILDMYPHITFIIPSFFARRMINENVASKGCYIPFERIEPYIQQNRFLEGFDTMDIQTREGIHVRYRPYITTHGDILNVAIELDCRAFNTFMLYASDLDTTEPIVQPCGLCICTCVCPVPEDEKVPSTQNGLPYHGRPYDVIFLEANYDETLLHEILSKPLAECATKEEQLRYQRAQGNIRHISEQAAFAYVAKQLSNDGCFIPLHASSEFGTLHQK